MPDDTSNRSKLDPMTKIGIVLAAVFGLLFVVFALPTVQKLLYTTFVIHPELLQVGIISVLLGAGAAYYRRDHGSEAVSLGVSVTLLLMFVGLIVAIPVADEFSHVAMTDQIQTENPQTEQLPETSPDNLRVLPRGVSDNYADSSMQEPQYGLSDSDLAYRDGKYQWSYAIEPNNFVVSLTGNQKGALYTNLEQTEKDVTTTNSSFKTGQGQIWFDSHEYASVLANPLTNHKWDTRFNFQHEGESYIAHSTVTHDWQFRFPFVYSVPVHDTVQIMDTDGNIESLSAEEAQDDPRLEHQNTYPYDVAMFKVQSMNYRNGIINKYTDKEGVFKVSRLASSNGNQWPLAVPTVENGSVELTYFVSVEPTGSGTGVYQVYTLDGQTGELNYKQYQDTQLGSQRAIDFVERQPDINRLSNAQAVSPVPVTKDNQLYWHVKVIPTSESGLIYTAFVNASSGDVTLLEGTEPIYAFMTQDEVEEVQQTTESAENTVTVTVAVLDESGEEIRQEEIDIPEGGNADINVQNPTEDEE